MPAKKYPPRAKGRKPILVRLDPVILKLLRKRKGITTPEKIRVILAEYLLAENLGT